MNRLRWTAGERRFFWTVAFVAALWIIGAAQMRFRASAQIATPTAALPTIPSTAQPVGTPAPVKCWPALNESGETVAWCCYTWHGLAFPTPGGQRGEWWHLACVPNRSLG